MDPAATYRLNPLHPDRLLTAVETATGAYLMEHGLHFKFPKQDVVGTLVVLERLP